MKIKCAAIKYKDKVYEGNSHPEIGMLMLKHKVCPRPYPGGQAQGFVTECGKFVSREEALAIAICSGQVTYGETVKKHELYSEDLRGTVPPEKYWINRKRS